MSRRSVVRLLLALLLGSGVLACKTPAVAPYGPALEADLVRAPMLPERVDYAAVDLAAASLVGDLAGAARALQHIEADATRRKTADEPPTGLTAYAIDLWNATRYPGRRYRKATQALLDRDDVPEALEERLEQTLQDDPLALADARNRDARTVEAARLFNSLAEPAGKAITTTAMLPYHIATSMAGYLLQVAEQKPLPVQKRQALGLWKQFLRRYPDDPEAPRVAAEIAEAQEKWHETHHLDAHEKADDALDAGLPRHALFHAERGLRHAPDDEDCLEIRDEAIGHLAARDERMRVYLETAESGQTALPPGTRDLALAILAPDGDPEAALASLPTGHALSAEARFAVSTVHGETGRDEHMNAALREIAGEEGGMARHALTLLADPVRNPYGAFDTLRTRDDLSRTLFILTGPALAPPQDDSAIAIGRWALGLPMRVQAIIGLPLRLAAVPFNPPPPATAETAIQARRYMARHPDGQHAVEVSAWLEEYERSRENWLGTLEVVSARPDPDPAVIEDLRERAATQALTVAEQEERRDLRNAMLHNVTRRFPDTEAGRRAGRLSRTEVETIRAHSVQISRGFLEENPQFAGPNGLGLEPALLDGDNRNGELHPDGVRLIGGHEIEISYIDASGDEDEPAEHVVTRVSDARLKRVVARLEERSFHNSLIDVDDPIESDAQRDILFERARLGLADEVDTRASAEASYGMVRTRESILPFDLVLQGSLETLTLGAFPRMRTPEKTPDAILYE